MNIFRKINILMKINSAYEKVSGIIKGEKMTLKEMATSKTIRGIIISSAVGIIHTVNPAILSTPIATAIISIATALAIYGRIDANTPKE